MKKILFSFATLFLGALTFVSCSNDDDIQPADPITISKLTEPGILLPRFPSQTTKAPLLIIEQDLLPTTLFCK